MSRRNEAISRLGIEYPIIQGPFGGGLSTSRLVAAVSNLGGLGSFGAYHLAPAAIGPLAAEIRGQTAKPFALNLWVSDHDEGGERIDQAEFDRIFDIFRPYFRELDVDKPAMPARYGQSFGDQAAALIEAAPEPVSGARQAIDPETAAQLEALGYLGTAPSRPLGDERALLEVSGVDPSALSGDIDQASTASGFKLSHQYEQSAAIYREVIARHPDSVVLLMRLSNVLSELDADDERFEILTKVIALDPEMASAYSDLAHIVFKRGDPARAEQLLATSLRIAPCTAGPRATLAYLAAHRNDHARELQLLEEGVEQCPPHNGLLNSYAYALATSPDSALRNGEEALRLAKQINQGEPRERPDYLDTLACAYAEVGDFANAVRVGEQTLAVLDPAGDPRLAADLHRLGPERGALGLRKVRARRREPREPDLAAGARRLGIDLPHVLDVVGRRRVVDRVHRDRFGVVVDRDVGRAAKRQLDAGGRAAASREGVDDRLVVRADDRRTLGEVLGHG